MKDQVKDLAIRYRNARGVGLKVLGALGASAEGLLDKLPASARDGLDNATLKALEISFDTAARSRGSVPDTGQWLTRALTIGTGAAGGFGGLPSALAELPITTTVILRAIQGIAEQHGFDPSDPDTRAECLEVFASAGPLSEDDGTDLTFLTLRMSVTGASVQALLKNVAPKLALVLGQKLAAQTVPVLGAATGAAINYSFTSYYQEMAHVSFGLRKLAEDTGSDRAALIEAFRQQVSGLALSR
ncbi:EcsC family protein [Litoreibacter janthinus]|uniref:EcsC protein family protein n=1 Tax=Litoreibacter janthinus TaxID=670154 RepID=A0A1I6HUD7_9RHOB|nr:EcsC family protein [Litoreibacter janthinus]SFR58028.1 EcsC protein family protein [Litoreibacter janthinus]